MLLRRSFSTKAAIVGVVLYASIMFLYFCRDSSPLQGQTSPIISTPSTSAANSSWLERYTTDIKPIDRFYYGSTTGGPSFPAIYIAFVVPGCRSRSAAVVPSHGFGVVETGLGDALDSLLKHTSRPLHVDVLVAKRSMRVAFAILLENLTPRMREGVGAVVDLLRLEPLIGRLAASSNVSSHNSTSASKNRPLPRRRWLFSVCTGMHRLFRVQRLLLLEPGVQIHADITLLWDTFHQFPAGAVFGLAREQSARYAWVLSRRGNASREPGSRNSCGEPPTSDGLPGLNSAVALLDLDALRRSAPYERLSSREGVDQLAREYGWRGGSLADEDFYTMAACWEPRLLHMLPCSWNRQVPARNRAPHPAARTAVSPASRLGDGLYTWCDGGTYACSAHCPGD